MDAGVGVYLSAVVSLEAKMQLLVEIVEIRSIISVHYTRGPG